ncbi:MAG: hypothetical protein NTW16_09640 [Bacteroidetes bacterium]|nr:hypothetical protein [Bacteroidota bacterium]
MKLPGILMVLTWFLSGEITGMAQDTNGPSFTANSRRSISKFMETTSGFGGWNFSPN